MAQHYGATQADWGLFSLGLGLTADLLPVVSNPGAKISPGSTMQALGKTPSRYNRNKHAVGIPDWTKHKASSEDVGAWAKQPDYGICLQTREVRALDLDITDADAAQAVLDFIQLRHPSLPVRLRKGSPKCLLAFTLPGEYAKRVIKLGESGMIEFLATGQQFVAAGTHPSGARYEWDDKLDGGFPVLSPEQFEQLWSGLVEAFGTEVRAEIPSKATVLNQAVANDPTAVKLIEDGWVKSQERDGRLHIRCPFEHEHTTPSAISATTYFPQNTGGYQFGHFDCRHAHCTHRTDDEFKAGVGIPVHDPFDDFEVVPDALEGVEKGVEKGAKGEGPPGGRFRVVRGGEFAKLKPQGWIVKGVLPKADLGVVYGSSGSGKTFFVLDLCYAIAQGIEWRGNRVNQGNVVYIAAEDSGGVRARFHALGSHHGVDLDAVGVGVIPDTPNFLVVDDVKDVIRSVKAFGPVSVIVVDTLAQVIPGGDENSGEDVGKVLKHCREIRKHTGGMVLLVHHSGKDATKGARGWSGLRAACDVELEVLRVEDDRVATVTKMKNGMDGAEYPFKLLPVQVGLDEDGDPVSSCVVEHTAALPNRRLESHKTGKNEKLVRDIMEGLLGVGRDKIAYQELVDAVSAQMVPPENGKRDRRPEIIKQAVESLRGRGEVVVCNGFLNFSEEAA